MNKRARRERIDSLKDEIRTMVFYEAPHKLVYTLKDLYEVLGNRRIALARELTKKFEEILRCTLKEAIEKYENESPRGEYVLVVEGADEKQIIEDKKSEWNSMSILEHYQMYIDEGLSRKEAMKKVAQDRGISKGMFIMP